MVAVSFMVRFTITIPEADATTLRVVDNQAVNHFAVR